MCLLVSFYLPSPSLQHIIHFFMPQHPPLFQITIHSLAVHHTVLHLEHITNSTAYPTWACINYWEDSRTNHLPGTAFTEVHQLAISHARSILPSVEQHSSSPSSDAPTIPPLIHRDYGPLKRRRTSQSDMSAKRPRPRAVTYTVDHLSDLDEQGETGFIETPCCGNHGEGTQAMQMQHRVSDFQEPAYDD